MKRRGVPTAPVTPLIVPDRGLLEVGDGSPFPASGHLAAYAGPAPATRRSGTRIRGEHPPEGGNKQLDVRHAMLRNHAPYQAPTRPNGCPSSMGKIVILGRGGAGRSTLAAHLGTALALPVMELAEHFWAPDPTPTPEDRWTDIQRRLTSGQRWVIDGDLGPYDVLDVRLRAADTVIVLDFPLWRCAWRALRRSRENLAFWRWVLAHRRRSLPTVMTAIARNAAHADLRVLRSPRAVEQLLNHANAATPPDQDPSANPQAFGSDSVGADRRATQRSGEILL